MTSDLAGRYSDVPCRGCGAPLPPMDDIEFEVARDTQPEGFLCDECSARLTAAPSFAAWLDSECVRQKREYQRAHQQREDTP